MVRRRMCFPSRQTSRSRMTGGDDINADGHGRTPYMVTYISPCCHLNMEIISKIKNLSPFNPSFLFEVPVNIYTEIGTRLAYSYILHQETVRIS